MKHALGGKCKRHMESCAFEFQNDFGSTAPPKEFPPHEDSNALTPKAVMGQVTFPISVAQNSKYFEMEHLMLGTAFLVGMSQFHFENMAVDLSHAEIDLYMTIASLVWGLTNGQQEKFAHIMKQHHTVLQLQSLRESGNSPHS